MCNICRELLAYNGIKNIDVFTYIKSLKYITVVLLLLIISIYYYKLLYCIITNVIVMKCRSIKEAAILHHHLSTVAHEMDLLGVWGFYPDITRKMCV